MQHTHVLSQQPAVVPTRIAFVGEAPSDEEMEAGQPFVGPSGRVFNGLLRTANLDRSAYFIGNVFDEQIPDNDLASSGWLATRAEAQAGGFDDLPPLAGGFLRPDRRASLHRLAVDLARCSPTVVVPLGGTALWAFTGSENIGQTRGAVAKATYLRPGQKLVPTYHPAMVLRQWKFYTVVVGDLLKAAREAANGKEVRYPPKVLHTAPSLPEVTAFCERAIQTADLLSVDIETAWGQISCIGIAPSQQEAMCIPFVDFTVPNRSYWPDSTTELAAWEAVGRVLASEVPKLGQNFAGYDALWLLEKKGYPVRNLEHDTRLLHHALYAELPKDLAFMGASYTELGPWKTMRRKQNDKRDS